MYSKTPRISPDKSAESHHPLHYGRPSSFPLPSRLGGDPIRYLGFSIEISGTELGAVAADFV